VTVNLAKRVQYQQLGLLIESSIHVCVLVRASFQVRPDHLDDADGGPLQPPPNGSTK
jgi:hypothetical protein